MTHKVKTDAQLDASIRYHEKRMEQLLTRIQKNHTELSEARNTQHNRGE